MKLAFFVSLVVLGAAAFAVMVFAPLASAEGRARLYEQSRIVLLLCAVAFFAIAVGRYIGYW